MAVYEAASESIERARRGKGPTVVECKTYRIKGHFIGDPEVYRSKDEVKSWQTKDKDPIQRFKTLLLEKEVLTPKKIDELDASIQEEIEEAVVFAEQGPDPLPQELTTDVYAD
jgi:pyruvate dehydrogenase E1 component alpha subunit